MQEQLCNCYVAARRTQKCSSPLLQQTKEIVPLRDELRYSIMFVVRNTRTREVGSFTGLGPINADLVMEEGIPNREIYA